MTRYANRPRNADIVAAFFTLHLAPKQIAHELKPRYPEITVNIVYKVIEMFQVEPIGEIRRSTSLENRE